MGSAISRTPRASILLLLLGAGISILWGIALERGSHSGVMGFPGVYLGTRCLLQRGDPYNVEQLQRVYESAGLTTPSQSTALQQSATLYVNLPTTFLFVAPFALLPFAAAQTAWLILTVSCFVFGAFLMWRLGNSCAPGVSVFLVFIVLANCEVIFSGGNSAGLVVGLCVIAAWCFLQERFARAGVVCLAIGVAIKPHDAGLIWLYFLLAGRHHTKRAIQSGLLALAFAGIAFFWVSHVAPNWLPEFRSNLGTISAHGGINEPGPTSIGAGSADMIIDLQTFISVLCDDSHIYNPITYAVCAVLLAVWSFVVLRSEHSAENAWFALVSVVSLSMLVTYHRSYDARLLLLSIPACCMLWVEGGAVAKTALVATTAGIVFTSDIPLAILMDLTRGIYSPRMGIAAKALVAVVTRPAPLILLFTAIFYLYVYLRRSRKLGEEHICAEPTPACTP
jgi:hypothetical protein